LGNHLRDQNHCADSIFSLISYRFIGFRADYANENRSAGTLQKFIDGSHNKK